DPSLCTSVCSQDTDCPDPASGTAVQLCAIFGELGRFERCMLACDDSLLCPEGMECQPATECVNCQTSLCVWP
nr:hypothetical protein [Deltaproteobacteria bacterium]